jgi:hypothetical protein
MRQLDHTRISGDNGGLGRVDPEAECQYRHPLIFVVKYRGALLIYTGSRHIRDGSDAVWWTLEHKLGQGQRVNSDIQ